MKTLIIFLAFGACFATFFTSKKAYNQWNCALASSPDIIIVDSSDVFQTSNTSYSYVYGYTKRDKIRNTLLIAFNGRSLLKNISFQEARKIGMEIPVWNSGPSCTLKVRSLSQSQQSDPNAKAYKNRLIWSCLIFSCGTIAIYFTIRSTS